MKDGPLPPLLTTGNPGIAAAGGIPGALGQPGTVVLYGNSPIHYPALDGLRATFGMWVDEDANLGLEVVGIVLPRTGDLSRAASNAQGSPPLYVPFFNILTGQQDSFPIADPLKGISGNIAIQTSVQLWGIDGNVFWRVCCKGPFLFDVMLGFRYLDLRETLDTVATFNVAVPNVQNVYFEGFETRNQFYGGQGGLRLGYHPGPLSLDLTGKVAMGSMHELVNLGGAFSQAGPGAPNPGTFFQGGVFVQPTNIGIYNKAAFSVLPQVGVQAGWAIFDWVRVLVGYDFLYLTNAVRPGNQIDTNVNPTQFALGATLIGPALPQPIIRRSDFYAHGLSAGMEVRY
jgi:hypothetical protein